MKIIPKFQNAGKLPTKEYNKRKQQFLNQNGIKVKINGSWGPWQEEQYRRLTTKDKHYNTTPLGFLSYLYDKTLGDGTTYQEDPAFVKGYSGEIKSDNRSSARRYLDQQMQDNKTPLGYITQTVVPSAAVASSIVYGGPAIVNGIRTAVSNPSTILPTAKTLVKEGVKGVAGATAVNAASKVTTGKTWGEQVAQSTGVSSGLGEFTNPGFVLGSPVYKTIDLVTPLSVSKVSKFVQIIPKTVKQKYIAPYVSSRIINRSINANPKGYIVVSENYFNSPNNWYRITNTPEVYGIKEVGKNVTTRDSGVLVDVPSDNWRISVLEQPLIRDKEGFLMLDPNRHNQSPRLFQKTGSAHGNTSQASKGQMWQNGISNSSMFPTVILEGQAARQVPMGITRTDFKLTPWEDIPMGQRIGFHTGEMPLDNLRYFQKLGNGKYSYQGTIIPDKRINAENY